MTNIFVVKATAKYKLLPKSAEIFILLRWTLHSFIFTDREDKDVDLSMNSAKRIAKRARNPSGKPSIYWPARGSLGRVPRSVRRFQTCRVHPPSQVFHTKFGEIVESIANTQRCKLLHSQSAEIPESVICESMTSTCNAVFYRHRHAHENCQMMLCLRASIVKIAFAL